MLTDRQKLVLKAIVESYTESKELDPVGSHTLMKMDGLSKFSSATLRNEMAELEELGYLEKTHTSSGRIPTELGYRLYVDELMDVSGLEEEFDEQINQILDTNHISKKDMAKSLVKTIVDNPDFNYGAVILEKTAFNSKIRRLDFVPLKSHRGVVVLITDQGLVLHKEITLPEGIVISDVEKTMHYLDSYLHDCLLNDFKNATKIKFPDDGFFDYMANSEAVIEICLRSIYQLVEDKRSIIGQYNILNHPELSEISAAQKYLECIKDGSIYQMVEFDNGPLPVISSSESSNITIRIGNEIGIKSMNECSSITAYYQSKTGTGAITIYGPIRMKYKYIVASLKAIVKNMQ